MVLKVVDHLSNKPENLVEFARFIGKNGNQRRLVFEAVCFHKKKTKTVSEICRRTGLERKQVLVAGKALSDHACIHQTKADGETAYTKDDFLCLNKKTIFSLSDNPEKQAAFRTKRNPAAVRSGNTVAIKPVHFATRKNKTKRIRLAFLTTNPDADLRTDIESRNVTQAINRSRNRDYVEINYYPAAQFNDLLDALNDFRPNIVHFSGHGGAQAIVFDGGTPIEPEACVVDFDLLQQALAATTDHPRLIILNACSTFEGAEKFLETAEHVVAMSDSILDATATLFATQFYSALAAKQSLYAAVEQGKVIAKVAGVPDSDIPTIASADGKDPKTTIFK